MKILVISDTHRHIKNVMKLLTVVTDIDRIIHLGDVVGDAQDLESIYSTIPIDYIAGNCDFYEYDVPKEKIVQLMGNKIFLTHGHAYDVKRDYDKIASVALEKQVDAVLFGHTHAAYCGYANDIVMMNPGSISQPRDGKMPSYGILEIDLKGKIHASLNQLKLF